MQPRRAVLFLVCTTLCFGCTNNPSDQSPTSGEQADTSNFLKPTPLAEPVLSGLQIIQYDDGRYCLTVIEPGSPDEWYWKVFEERQLQSGGHTWEGIIESLVKIRMPDASSRIEIGAEADNAYVNCNDRQTLEKLAALINEAVTGRDLLLEAMDNAEYLE